MFVGAQVAVEGKVDDSVRARDKYDFCIFERKGCVMYISFEIISYISAAFG